MSTLLQHFDEAFHSAPSGIAWTLMQQILKRIFSVVWQILNCQPSEVFINNGYRRSNMQAPIQLTTSSVNLLSLVVSPAFMLKLNTGHRVCSRNSLHDRRYHGIRVLRFLPEGLV